MLHHQNGKKMGWWGVRREKHESLEIDHRTQPWLSIFWLKLKAHVPIGGRGELWKMICSFAPYGAFTLDDVKSMLIENLGGILGGIKCQMGESLMLSEC